MQLFSRQVSPPELIAFTFEIILISGSLMLGIHLQSGVDTTGLIWKILLAAVLCQLCLYYNDFYDFGIVRSGRELVVRLVQAAGAASILLAVIYLIAPSVAVRSSAFLQALAITLVAVLAWRLVFNRIAQATPFVEPILVVGTGSTARAVEQQLLVRRDFAHRIIGFVDDGPEPEVPLRGVRVIGSSKDIPAIVARYDIRRIIVGLDDPRRLPLDALAQAKLSGVFVQDAATAYERLTGKILLEELRLSGLVFSEGFGVTRSRRVAKRLSDLTLSIVGLVVFAPLMALTAVLVWLGSGRPILYRQARVGEYGRVFTLYKFRSMHRDAEANGPTWASAHDDRVTPVGRFIRLTRLDELPQLWNVLRGDMSFVGPRPERPHFVERLAEQIPFYHLRHTVKPGVTGWAQVKYRYAASVEDTAEKLRYDLYYVKHFSMAFDITIVLDTVKTILFQRGSQ
jgi:sugar transferase (PEP-CTERM system associated)